MSAHGGPLRHASRDLVRLVCPSCSDEIRFPADEIRPTCQRCCVVLDEPGSPCRRPHDFAVTELVIRRGDEVRRLYPIPGGFEEAR